MNTPPENLNTLRAVELARLNLLWLPLGFMVAQTWFGRRLDHAANDEHFTP